MKKKNLTVLLVLLLAAGVVSCAALESASACPRVPAQPPYGASNYDDGGSDYDRGGSGYGDSAHGATLELRRFGARRAFRLRRHALRRLTLRALEAGERALPA